MKLTLTLVLSLGVLATGCGGGDSKSSTKSNADQASTPTDTQAKKGSQSGTSPKQKPPAPSAKTTKLSSKERKSAQAAVVSITRCLRAQDAKVSTASNDPKSITLKAGNGSMLRITWKGNGADGYVSTPSNVRAEAKVVRKGGHLRVYQGRFIVLYDKAPSKSEKALLDHCGALKGIA